MRRSKPLLAAVVLAVCAMTTAPGQEEGEVVTNADVVTLTEAGLSAAAIMAVIEASRTDFDIGVAQLAALSQAGVDSAVIEAMARAAAEVSAGDRPGPASPSTPALQPGDTFSDTLSSGGQGPEMVVIPAGNFRMGCVSGVDCDDVELPVHDVAIPQAFAVSKREVTFEDYDLFTHPNRVYDEDDFRREGPRHPVNRISWNDARDYVAWLSRQTGQTYRLLSEAEWEYVARAGRSTAYSWGDDIGSNRANCGDHDYSEGYGACGDQWSGMAPVGSFAPNAFGVHDMHGNAGEWVEDCWHDSYAGAPSDGSAWRAGDCVYRVVRSGSLYGDPEELRSAARDGVKPEAREYAGQGIRVARMLP